MTATLDTAMANTATTPVSIQDVQDHFRLFREQCPPARRSKYLTAEWVQFSRAPYQLDGATNTYNYEEMPSKIIPANEVQVIRIEEIDGSVFVDHGTTEHGVPLYYGLNQLLSNNAKFCSHSRLRTSNAPCAFGLSPKARGFEKEAELVRWALTQRARRVIEPQENIFLEDGKNGSFEAILDGTPHSVRFWMTGESNERWANRERDLDADPMETCFGNIAHRLATNPRIDFANLRRGDEAHMQEVIANYLGLLQVSYTTKEADLIMEAAAVLGQARHLVLPDIQMFREFAQQKTTNRVAIPQLGSWFLTSCNSRRYSAYAPVVVVHPSNYARDLKAPQPQKPVSLGSLDFLNEDDEENNSTGNA